jgi:FkbM family methyltransferase
MDVDLDTLPGIHVYRHGYRDDVADALDLLLRPGDVVVDGGANLGGFSLVAASIVGRQGAVHSIEAAPGTAAELRRSVAANPRCAIHVHQAALAEAPGELEFTTFEAGHGGASLAPQPGGTVVRVPATTLDALTEPLERVDLVKLDVEGAELRALRGARRLLAEHKPLLVLEFEPAHLERSGDSPAALEALLTEAGYEAFEIAVDGPRTRFVALPSPWRRPAGEPNILLVPAARRGRLDGALT